jgi:hypothetical protein
MDFVRLALLCLSLVLFLIPLFLVSGLAYVPTTRVHPDLMTLYDGYCSDSFTTTFQPMYAVMACFIGNIIFRKPHILSALGP